MKTYGDTIRINEDIDNFKCPFCNEPNGMVIDDYTGFHERETLIHCMDCDNLYIIVYVFSHIIKLNKETVPNV